MGKSSKKLKSDRINALRKQYDAFLEEDKKRKNRNEYILGWLDRVRSGPAVTPSRYKENPCFSKDVIRKDADLIPRKYPVPDACSTNAVTPYIKKFDYPNILDEISKNYILIPKKYSIPESNNSYRFITGSNTTNDSDWKSKYNILNELKNNEKEECPPKEISQQIPQEISTSIFSTKEYEKNPIKLDKDIPEKENLSKKYCKTDDQNALNLGVIESNKNKIPNIQENKTNLPDSNESIVEKCTDTNKISIEISKNDENSVLKTDAKDNIDRDYPQNNVVKNPDELISKLAITNDESNAPTQLDFQYPTKEEINPLIIAIETSANNDSISQERDYKPLHKQESQSELEFESSQPINETIMSVAQKQDIQQFENPEPQSEENNTVEISSEQIDDIGASLIEPNMQYQPEIQCNDLVKNEVDGNELQIEQFETEQNQMFYSGDPNENYAYSEQTGENIQGNESAYQNNEQYSYYEAVKDEPNYGTEINEHEESTERYDQNYEQQYVNQYDENTAQYQNEYAEKEFYNVPSENTEYNQQQYENYEQQNYDYQQSENAVEQQQYDHAVNDPAEQENQNIIYDQFIPQDEVAQNENSEQVEQQMDLEDGYADEQKIVQEERDLENINTVEAVEEIEQT